MASSGVLQVRWHGRLDTSPLPLPNTVRLSDKVEGMLLGLAIGDALGNTSESINPSDRLCRHGWIENYLPNRHAAGRPIGLPSDDTQLAAWTMEQLIEDGRLEPQLLGQRFAAGRIFGIGQAMREFLSNFKSGTPWQGSGARSAGNDQRPVRAHPRARRWAFFQAAGKRGAKVWVCGEAARVRAIKKIAIAACSTSV